MKLTKKGFRVFTKEGTKKEFVITIPLSQLPVVKTTGLKKS